uniref:Ubiquitin-like domain-containing protein n=1 Tax=Strigamia maritima TaxID=126957 RepID=T1IX06_STRMM
MAQFSVTQHGASNICTTGNNISIHIENFNSGQFLDNKYFHSLDVNPNILKSLIPVFENTSTERFEVRIKTNRGIVTLDVHPSDQIQSIKLKLQLLYGILYNKQFLAFEEKVLHDKDKLTDYNIERSSLLYMVYSTEENGMIFQRIHGRWFCLPVEPETPVPDLKNQIEIEEGLPADRQQLFLDDGKVLKDDKRISDYSIAKNQVVKVATKQLKDDMITVVVKQLTGHHIELTMGKYETIEDLKKQIELKANIDQNSQQLLFNSSKLSEDNFTLANYYTTEKLTLHLVKNIYGGGLRIRVRTSIGEIISLGSQTENVLIREIKSIIEESRGFLVQHQRLFYLNEELKDDSKPIGDCLDISKIAYLTLEMVLKSS